MNHLSGNGAGMRAARVLDARSIKEDFPILKTEMGGRPLVYLDSAATSQKPQQVIDAISDYYENYNANIHRGIYKISERATARYIESKEKTSGLIGANGIEEIVYTRNTTESINLVALTWGEQNIRAGDHILISDMEHHSNMVPWQLLAERKKAILDYVGLDSDKAQLSSESLRENLAKHPKIVAITHVSNVLGTINPVQSIVREAHEVGAVVLVDGAQAAPHMPVDMKGIDCDFYAFSSHKMLGPTGLGVLYAKAALFESIEPLFGGGDMISTVTRKSHSWNSLPWKFEAGTSNIAGGIGFGAAIDYLNAIGMDLVFKHEQELAKYAVKRLSEVPGVEVYGPVKNETGNRLGVVSFGINGVHPHDVAQIFDSEGIAIRAGHLCAMPLVTEVLNKGAVSRMSFYVYNDVSDIDKAIEAISKVKKTFRIE